MPFLYERDAVKHRVVVTMNGVFSKTDGLAILERHRVEGIADYEVLFDLRGRTGESTIVDVRSYTRGELSIVPVKGARGPIAIVADDPVIYRMACVFAALGSPKLNIEVFREYADAEAWLATQS
jgi:hypothetical protein